VTEPTLQPQVPRVPSQTPAGPALRQGLGERSRWFTCPSMSTSGDQCGKEQGKVMNRVVGFPNVTKTRMSQTPPLLKNPLQIYRNLSGPW
jgi:hypothetical protein